MDYESCKQNKFVFSPKESILSCNLCNRMMECVKNSDICFRCQQDPAITISRYDIKKKYKLSENEIEEYKFKCVYTTFINKKYQIVEVEELCEKLTQNFPTSNKKKIAYQKQKKIMDNTRNQKKELDIIKKNVVDNVCLLLCKYNMDISTNIKNKINYQANKYCTNLTVNISSISLLILDNILEYNNQLVKEVERKKDLDFLINYNIDKKYDQVVQNLYVYDDYVKLDKYSLYITYLLILNYLNIFGNDKITISPYKVICYRNII